jgi:hypothetical protein
MPSLDVVKDKGKGRASHGIDIAVLGKMDKRAPLA